MHFLEGTFPVATPSQSKHSGDPEPAAGIPRPNSSEPSDHNQTWCIKQEVERLMEDHNKFTSSKPSKAPAACTQVVRQTFLTMLLFLDYLHLMWEIIILTKS